MKNSKINIPPWVQNSIKVFCIVAMLVLCLISVVIYGASVSGLLILILFFLFYVQIPGLLLTDVLGFSKSYKSTNLAIGIFLGWAFNIIIYFISDILPTNMLLYVSAPVLSLLYVYNIFKGNYNKRIEKGFKFSKLSPSLCIFMLIIFFYSIVIVQYNYLSPSLSDFTVLNPDKAYHLGLINSLSHDYPLESPWVAGRIIHYHVFSEILLSIPVRLFGVQSDLALMSFGPLLTAYVFGISLYSFFKEMSGKPDRAGAYCLIVVLSNIYLTRTPRSSLALRFALENDNSTGYGIAAVLISIIVFRKWYDIYQSGNQSHWKYLTVFVILTMLTTGIKGPLGLVMVASVWGAFVLGMILRKVSPKSIVPLLYISGGFILTYLTILKGRGMQNASGESIISFGRITNIAFWKKPLIEFLDSIGIGGYAKLMIILIVFAMFFFTVFFVPFCIGYLRELILVLSGRKSYEPYRVMVYAACAVGYILMFFMRYSGHSQVYFGLVTVFLSPIVAFWFLEDMEAKQSHSNLAKYTLNGTLAVMSITIIATTLSLSIFLSMQVDNAVKATNPAGYSEKYKYITISDDEYDAMQWLYENTDKDALLATDRYYSVDPDIYAYDNRWDNRFFLYSVYSNRFTYISGSGYNMPGKEWTLRKKMIETNMQLYDASNENRGKLARELGVDYVVVSKRFTNCGNLENKDYILCYSNEDIDIYEIS